MAYGVKYIMQFISDRGNEIRIEVLKKDYQGEVMYKSLGGSPSLSIEQGDAAVKGSSLVFAMQADMEGELQELYTTDNKLFKVNMYRNEVLSWQGYVLPELYSEEYVDAPYDVSVTATDQLATLKAITYQREDVNVSISTMIEDILSFTQVSLPVTYHQNLSAIRKGEVPMLVDSHISQAAYNGYSCYDVLTNILLSCNCCIMQINGEWLITSLTNSTTNYYTAGVNVVREHKILGQLGVGEVCPTGTLTMVNNPALKGAKVEYAHMLRNSFLVNADCVDREGWNYTPDSRNPIDIPGEREAFGKIFKTYCWELHPVNIREDNSLQLWQEVALEKDERNYYDLSVKTLFGTNAKLLLMAVTYLGSDGIERRLTAEGWVEKWDKSDVNYYIQITGKEKNAGLDAIADIEQYEVSTVQFALPPVDGTMRIGFINSTTDYTDPLASAPIYVSQVYLTVSDVTGQECTTEVEPNATQEQQGVLLAYGDTFESENDYKLGLNTLKKSSGENITSWWLDNVNFSSYYETMLQEFSRYFGVKKAQLQGIIMGKDVLSNIYTDVFSGRVMRLLTAQVDLLADEASVTVEEIVTTTVNFDTVIYATNNTNSFGSSSGGGGGTSGGSSSTSGESLLGVQSDGDVYVKDGRALVGQEGRFENLALPVDAPTERKETKTYLYSSDPSKGAIDIAKIAKWIDEQEEMWVLDAENGVIKTTYNVVSEGEMMALRRASGSGGGGTTQITAQMITDALGYVPYSSLNPAGYITSSALNGYAKLTDIPISLPASDVYDWAKAASKPSYAFSEITGKPTTLGGYGITDAISTSGGVITGKGYDILTINRTDNRPTLAFAYNGTTVGYLGMTTGGVPIYVSSVGDAYSLYHSGNFNPNDYLPKSGGIISTTNSYYPIRIKCPASFGQTGIRLEVDDTNMGALVSTVGNTYIYNFANSIGLGIYNGVAKFGDNTLIHSGNIGSQSVNYANRAGNADSADVIGYTYGNQSINFANNESKIRLIKSTYGDTSANGFPSQYVGGISVLSDYVGWQMVTYGSISVPNPYFRSFGDNGQRSEWKQLAFLTDNVASATKLQTSSGTDIVNINDSGLLLIGGGSAQWTTVIDGTSIHLRAKNYAYGLFVNENGNVLIGTTTDNGLAKLQVGGAMTTTSAIRMTFYDTNTICGLYPNSWISSDGVNNRLWLYNGNQLALYGSEIQLRNNTSLWGRFDIDFGHDATSPTGQAITINSAAYASTYAAWPGIGFHIPGSTYATIKFGSDTCFHFMNSTLSGWVDIKVGNLVATGEVISLRRASSSDARLKDNINRLIAEDCLAIVRKLQPSSWQWKEDGKFSLGFIAQDIEPLMPYAVTRIKDEVLGLRLNLQYDQFFAPVVGAIQCLDVKVENHETRLKRLETENAELKKILSKYETVWQ